MTCTVAIDYLPESVQRYRDGYAVVAVDVIRATTTAVTAVAAGRRCFPVSTLEDAFRLARSLSNPLLAGELGGDMPQGFHMNNSPAELERRTDIQRPLILLSTSGTRLINLAAPNKVYLACFRNYGRLARHLAGVYPKIAVIGAGSRNEFREEDQMCCAWVAAGLIAEGYRALNHETAEIVERWRGAPPSACLGGKSAAYLRRSNQLHDLEFILNRIDDLDLVITVVNGEVVASVPRALAAITA